MTELGETFKKETTIQDLCEICTLFTSMSMHLHLEGEGTASPCKATRRSGGKEVWMLLGRNGRGLQTGQGNERSLAGAKRQNMTNFSGRVKPRKGADVSTTKREIVLWVAEESRAYLADSGASKHEENADEHSHAPERA